MQIWNNAFFGESFVCSHDVVGGLEEERFGWDGRNVKDARARAHGRHPLLNE